MLMLRFVFILKGKKILRMRSPTAYLLQLNSLPLLRTIMCMKKKQNLRKIDASKILIRFLILFQQPFTDLK